jgi:hypothetical protein
MRNQNFESKRGPPKPSEGGGYMSEILPIYGLWHTIRRYIILHLNKRASMIPVTADNNIGCSLRGSEDAPAPCRNAFPG